jgi:signal transduction histidine kinase
LEYYRDALPLFEKREDTFRLAQLYDLMGIVYYNMDMQTENLLYSEKAVDLLNENPDTLLRAYALMNYALALMKWNEFEKAENYLLEAQRICLLQNSKYGLCIIYNNLGDIALQKYDLEKMEQYFRKSLSIALELGNVTGYCISNRGLAYEQLYRRNFKKSEEYTQEALETANKYDLPVEKMKCYRLLSDLSTARHDFRNYVFYGEKADSIQATITSELTIRAAKEMEAKYETEKKELEIEKQKQIISRQNMQQSLLVASIVMCVIILVLLWYMLQLRNRRNRILAEMNATKDKFFSIISHDLKNPALALRDSLQLLIQNARTWEVDFLIEYYHGLLKSAEGQVELLYNLLNWAQIQTGRIAYSPTAFNLSTRLRPDISLINKMTESKGISLTVEMSEDTLITGDANMLTTVIRNLLTNAVKFTPPGGKVTWTVSPGAGGINSAPTGYTVTVTDTGIGMNAEQIRKLFNVLTGRDKAHPVSSNSHRGTAGEEGSGLGLIVCKELLGKHGSLLQVESEQGKGSRFWFEISG